MESTVKRLCIDCHSPIHGRIDKKFCHDHCRSNYNNKLRAESNETIKSINLVLKRNRDILQRFNPHGKIRINRSKLIAAGFDPNYHTHTTYSKKDGHFAFCYEQGFQKDETDDFILFTNLDSK